MEHLPGNTAATGCEGMVWPPARPPVGRQDRDAYDFYWYSLVAVALDAWRFWVDGARYLRTQGYDDSEGERMVEEAYFDQAG
eukprot:2921102-Alexandrium_andersonii.AAC.1